MTRILEGIIVTWGAESCATEEILTDVDLKSIATNNLRRAAMPRNTIVISYAIVLYHRSEEYHGQPSEEYHTAPSGERSQPSQPPQHIHISNRSIVKMKYLWLIQIPAYKGSFHLRFSGIRPLRGGGTPLFR